MKGVSLNKGRYVARISYNGHVHHIGRYDTPEEAAAAYEAAVREYWGEGAEIADGRYLTRRPWIEQPLDKPYRFIPLTQGESGHRQRGALRVAFAVELDCLLE